MKARFRNAAAGILIALSLSGCTSGGSSRTSPPPVRTGDGLLVGSGQVHDFVLHDGDTVRGIGSVVAAPGQPVRFCVEGATIESTSFAACSAGVLAKGVDLNRLAGRATQNGVVRGDAELTGTYRRGTLTVTGQRAIAPSSPIVADTVPCPTPPGGWPRSADNQPSLAPVIRYARAHPGTIVERAYLDPPPNRTLVYVLTVGDPAQVTAALRPSYGQDLCVAKSRYTSAQLSHAESVTCDLMLHGNLDALTAPTQACGAGLAPDEQVATAAYVPTVSAHTAAIFDALPADLVQVTIWLAPLR